MFLKQSGVLAGICCAIILYAAGVCLADNPSTVVINTNVPLNTGGTVDYQNYDVGQSFKVPTDGHGILTSFTYWIFGSGGSPTYHAAIFPFDPATHMVTGAALFTSAPNLCPQQLPPAAHTFATALALNPGGEYLAAIHIDSTIDNAGVAFCISNPPSSNTYSDGEYVSTFGAAPYAGSAWTVAFPPGGDVAFSATFAAPEPAAMALVVPLLYLSRRNRRIL